ncbi:MAG: ZIP family metal transporter, partial [bacterium]
MMNIWLWTIGSVVVISLLSVIGAVGLLLKEKALNRALIYFVSFSAGSLLGGAFFHLLPESFDLSNDAMMIFGFLVIGFCAFFVLEKVLRWRHCHDHGCHEHAHIGWMNLIGGSVHNMLDGMVIAAAFMVGPFLGVPVVISIISHEIPHELGDFGVLLYSGFSKSKALLYNFISALFCLLGAVLVLS